MKGDKINHITAERISSYTDGTNEYWDVICDCGRVLTVRWSHVIKGKIKHCGCKRKHHRTKHGLSHTRTYKCWNGMKRRCTDTSERIRKYYLDKGITYCNDWENFDAFLRDMGHCPTDKHTLDRIDGTKGYYKENCRWATMSEQVDNLSSAIKITINGHTRGVKDWSNISGVSPNNIRARLRLGYSPEDAVFKKTHSKIRNNHI